MNASFSTTQICTDIYVDIHMVIVFLKQCFNNMLYEFMLSTLSDSASNNYYTEVNKQ